MEVERPSLDGLTKEIRDYIEHIEKFVATRTIGVSRNNRWPRWSFERWLLMIGLAYQVFQWSFFMGGEWRTVKQDVAVLKQDMGDVRTGVTKMESAQTDLRLKIESIERVDEYFRRVPPPSPVLERK